MYEDINKRLSKSRQDISRLKKIESMLKTLKDELYILEERSAAAEAELLKENKDYEKLTRKSASQILYSILGSIEEKTEKERREALEAELKYNQCLRELEDVRGRISRLESEKLQYQNAQAEHDMLYEEKLKLLMNENGKTARDIMELGGRIEQSKCNIREIDEAVGVGHEVQKSLSAVLDSLDSAGGWGVWDMLGGGLITNMIKHSHIDEASDAAYHAQSLLKSFRTELAEVRISEEIQIDISGFAKFADFFFDGFFADWFMQSKIGAAQESVLAVQRQVLGVMQKLNELKDAEREARENLNTQLNKLVNAA